MRDMLSNSLKKEEKKKEKDFKQNHASQSTNLFGGERSGKSVHR